MASSNSNVDHTRNILREQARKARVHEAQERLRKEAKTPAPLFGAPIKIRRDDAVHRQITDALGDYDDMHGLFHTNMVGVIEQPATPRPESRFSAPKFPLISHGHVPSFEKDSRRTKEPNNGMLPSKTSSDSSKGEHKDLLSKRQGVFDQFVKADVSFDKERGRDRSLSASPGHRGEKRSSQERDTDREHSKNKNSSRSKERQHSRSTSSDKDTDRNIRKDHGDSKSGRHGDRERHKDHRTSHSRTSSSSGRHSLQNESSNTKASSSLQNNPSTVQSSTNAVHSSIASNTISSSTSSNQHKPSSQSNGKINDSPVKTQSPSKKPSSSITTTPPGRERHDSASSLSSPIPDAVFHSPQGKAPSTKSTTNPSPTTPKKPFPKPNGALHNGARKRPKKRQNSGEQPEKKNLKLQMPNESHGPSSFSVDKIIQEMSFDEPPLTGLATPRKEDSSQFSFPLPKEAPVQQLFTKVKSDEPPRLVTCKPLPSVTSDVSYVTGNLKSDEPPRLVACKQPPTVVCDRSPIGSKDSIEEDLYISSDEEGEIDQVVESKRKSSSSGDHHRRSPKKSITSVKMSESSDTSSSGSESSSPSGSDSESSSSDNEEEKEKKEKSPERSPSSSPVPTNRSWALKNWKNAAPVPGIPTVPLSELPQTPDEPAIIMDDSNAELCIELLRNDLIGKSLSNITDFEEFLLEDEAEAKRKAQEKEHTSNSENVNKAKSGDNGLLFTMPRSKAKPEVEAVASPKVTTPGTTANVPTLKSPSASSVKSTSSGRSSVGKSPSRRVRKNANAVSGETDKMVAFSSRGGKGDNSVSTAGNKSLSRQTSQSGNTPKSKTPPRSERKPATATPKVGRNRKSPKSREFLPVSSSDNSDNEIDVVGLSPPDKINGDLKLEALAKQQQKSSQSKSAKCRENTNHVKQSSTPNMLDLEEVFDAVIGPSDGLLSQGSLLSPLPVRDIITPAIKATVPNVSISTLKMAVSPCTTTPSLPSGITFVDGKPSIMVHLDLSLLKKLPDIKKEEETDTNLLEVIEDNIVSKPPELLSPISEKCTGNTNVENVLKTEDQNKNSVYSPDTSKDNGITKSELPESSDVHSNSVGTNVSISTSTIDSADTQNTSTNQNTLSSTSTSSPVTAAVQQKTMDDIFKQNKLLPNAKIPKRKPESDSLREERKRPKTDAKTLPKRTGDQVSEKEKISHEDDHAWDRKHPRRSEERSGNSCSNSSSLQVSQNSERDSKRPKYERDRGRDRDKDRDRDRKQDGRDSHSQDSTSRERERDRDRTREKDRDNRIKAANRVRDWDAPSNGATENHISTNSSPAFNGSNHPAGSQWSAMASTGHMASPGEHRPSKAPGHRRPDRLWLEPHDKQHSADYYLSEAKKLKHQADSLLDRLAKSLMYVEAVLSFIQCGNAMEHDHLSESNKIFTMYRDTLNLLRHICKFRGSHEIDVHEKEKKLSVLSLRIQSLLCRKLFKLKKPEAAKLKRVIDDHNKSATSKPVVAQAPSPYQTNWNARSTGTPSPMSPTPSPAGSVGSVGSVGSGNGEHRLTNGNLSSTATTTSMSSPSTVSVPQRIHSVTQNYLTLISYLFQSEDLWDQADSQAHDYKEFFLELESHGGGLSLHSSILDLVRFVRTGLHRLKDT